MKKFSLVAALIFGASISSAAISAPINPALGKFGPDYPIDCNNLPPKFPKNWCWYASSGPRFTVPDHAKLLTHKSYSLSDEDDLAIMTLKGTASKFGHTVDLGSRVPTLIFGSDPRWTDPLPPETLVRRGISQIPHSTSLGH